MADLKISKDAGETGGPAESAAQLEEYLRKDGLYADPLCGALLDGGPAGNGYVAWTGDPQLATTAFQGTSTDVYVRRVFAPRSVTTSKADMWCTTLNSGTVTHAYAGLYDMAGDQLAASADIEAAFTGTGIQTFTWTTPYGLVAGSYYYVAYAFADTTAAPSMLATPTAAGINANMPSNTFRYATYSTSSTIPASITPSSLSAATTTPAWIGLR
jgi:hypothetical protein